MKGRKLVVLTQEQLTTVDWTRPNGALSSQLGLSKATVARLRKANNAVSLRRGRPAKVVTV